MPELLVAVLILVPLFVGVFYTFVKCMELSETAKNSSAAVAAGQNRLEEIENTAFNQVLATYNQTSFDTAGLNGKGLTYVNSVNANLLEVIVSVSWREKNGRIIGEDTNLNGQLDAGEDKNGNNRLDSTVQITTLLHDA